MKTGLEAVCSIKSLKEKTTFLALASDMDTNLGEEKIFYMQPIFST